MNVHGIRAHVQQAKNWAANDLEKRMDKIKHYKIKSTKVVLSRMVQVMSGCATCMQYDVLSHAR